MPLLINGKKAKMASCMSCRQLLQKLGLSPQECVVKVNGKPASDGKMIGKGDSVEVIRIVFGG